MSRAGGGCSCSPCSARQRCQPREVQRDLRLLRSEGWDVLQTNERPARSFLARPWSAQEVANDPVRAVIHHALLRLLHHHAPTPSRLYHETLLELSGQLPARLREVSLRSLTLPAGDTPRTLETLAAAWCWGEPVRFTYRKPREEPKTGEADVVFMEINRDNLDWYVFARRRGEGQVKTFHLSRFLDAARLTTETSPEIAFDPRRELDSAWGIIGGRQHCEVALRFAPEAVPYVAHCVWPGQVTGEMDGAHYLLRLKAPLNREHLSVEVMVWIRSCRSAT
ncbi:Transcriptional regulator, DeoR family (plasmid) [Deinococcus geothermalis DSM 11300]|uniref:Transcriptional regulator, DeoR family n=1 Tax=Deinococcus geothermalis (strain DSM 11300 / CIP 105573 / AG-3a) TaxID=319795 RepID=Q1J2Q1_DEIGD|nr:Transcriptional regulator, DeoR family [Deinococcus geothermalis DSM 11300]